MKSFFLRFFQKRSKKDSASLKIEETGSFVREEEEVECLSYEDFLEKKHESALRENLEFQQLIDGEEKTRLLKKAIRRDHDEATRKFIAADAKKAAKGALMKRLREFREGKFSVDSGDSGEEPEIYIGERGGRYYLVRSKTTGRLYRQYID